MSKARFRFATDILRRLGEELNPSLDQGVVELVKNAHDADASGCVVELINVAEPGGTLRVEDDGVGMTDTEVVDNFLLLGRSSKAAQGRTAAGRLLAGSKGLGRLAALRAGRRVCVTTRPALSSDFEHSLEIDWALFDEADTVDDVEMELTTVPRAPGAGPGTSIEVSSLSRSIGRAEVKRLARALLLLADPFEDTAGAFRAQLVAPEFDDLAELVERKYFDDAEYLLSVEVGDDGLASGRVTDWRGETLFAASHSDLRRSDRPYRCPPATFELWVFILDARTFQTRSSTVKEVRAWLAEFGGVMIYSNGIRVAPYGDPNNDWLDMNLQRTRNPEERPATNTSLGRVRVSDELGVLEAKTDRSGFIESAEFSDLRQFASDGLDWMARERLKAAEIRRAAEREAAPTETTNTRDKLESAIATAGESAPALERAFGRYERAREREVVALRRDVQLYRTLSTAGITAATFAHEASGGPLKVIGRAVGAIRRRLGKILEPVPDEIVEPLNEIESGASSLEAFTDTTLDLVNKDKRRTGRVDVHEVLRDVAQTYRPFIEARDAALVLELEGSHPYLRGSIAAVESIVVNLLTNALTALADGASNDRRIEVSTQTDAATLTILVRDNGPGIEDFPTSEIWLPGVTSRDGGSGLGLTIVRDTVVDLGGRASAKAHGPLGGAEFSVELPVLGA